MHGRRVISPKSLLFFFSDLFVHLCLHYTIYVPLNISRRLYRPATNRRRRQILSGINMFHGEGEWKIYEQYFFFEYSDGLAGGKLCSLRWVNRAQTNRRISSSARRHIRTFFFSTSASSSILWNHFRSGSWPLTILMQFADPPVAHRKSPKSENPFFCWRANVKTWNSFGKIFFVVIFFFLVVRAPGARWEFF